MDSLAAFPDLLLVPFQYEYMLKAIFVSAFIGGVCGLLSSFITLKGWSLMGDALSHSVVPGVALAYLAGLPFALGAFASGLLAAGAMGWIKARTRLREDAVIGIVFSTFFALGVLIISMNPSSISLKSILFGNILGIADSDILQMISIAALTLVVVLLKWRDLFLFIFDPTQARAIGLSTRLLHYTLLLLLAATTIAALQAVGAILVVAMLVTPGATAYLLSDRFGKTMGLAALIGSLSSLVGAYLSYFFNGATGGVIVVLQTVIFSLVYLLAPRHGLAAQRRAGRAARLALTMGSKSKARPQ